VPPASTKEYGPGVSDATPSKQTIMSRPSRRSHV
jgi:hypothetical protein